MADWVEKFFEDYAEAFRSNSLAGLLEKFTLPLIFLTRNGPITLNDEEGLSTNMDTLMDRYHQIGAVDFNYEMRRVQRIGSGIHLIEIKWRFFNASNEFLYACDTSYFLVGETSADAKVMAVIAHNEKDEYQKALNQQRGI
jgi:hypothetical protein